MEITIRHNTAARRFETQQEGSLAVLDYRQAAGVLTLVHTGVPSELEGQGIGGRLAKAALEYAREQGLQVIPQCPFVAAYIERHPEYADLVQ